jgi:lysylphosphatidylglycerol synthetase-like protein (DUF2156 family)
MATDQPLQPTEPIEHRTTRAGRWLRARRIRAALWIAVVEGILVAVLPNLTKWTIIALAIPLLALYLFWGRTARSDTARQATWIAGASQALAVVVTILAFLLSWLALVLAGIFAIVALLFLLSDRG